MTQHHEDALSEERRREVGKEAAEHILGPNPVVGVRGHTLVEICRGQHSDHINNCREVEPQCCTASQRRHG